MIETKKNDVILRDEDRWLYFSNPKKIIYAEKIDEVIPALQEIEILVDAQELNAAGYLSYESAAAFDAALLAKPVSGFPYLWFGLYPEPRTVSLPEPSRPKDKLNWQPAIDRDLYNGAVQKIKEYIADGKT